MKEKPGLTSDNLLKETDEVRLLQRRHEDGRQLAEDSAAAAVLIRGKDSASHSSDSGHRTNIRSSFDMKNLELLKPVCTKAG